MTELEERLGLVTDEIAHLTGELSELLAEAETQLTNERDAHEATARDREYWRQRTQRLTRERKRLAKENETKLEQAAANLAKAVEHHREAKRCFNQG